MVIEFIIIVVVAVIIINLVYFTTVTISRIKVAAEFEAA